MIYASAITESIVAPTLFRPEFLHNLDPMRTYDDEIYTRQAYRNSETSAPCAGLQNTPGNNLPAFGLPTIGDHAEAGLTDLIQRYEHYSE